MCTRQGKGGWGQMCSLCVTDESGCDSGLCGKIVGRHKDGTNIRGNLFHNDGVG